MRAFFPSLKSAVEFGAPRKALSSNWNILSFSLLPGEHLSLQASADLTFPNPQGWVANCPSDWGSCTRWKITCVMICLCVLPSQPPICVLGAGTLPV